MLTHGAAFVSSKIFRSFKSFGSGRVWRCFSKESRRSMGEIGEMSTEGLDIVSAIIEYSVQLISLRPLEVAQQS